MYESTQLCRLIVSVIQFWKSKFDISLEALLMIVCNLLCDCECSGIFYLNGLCRQLVNDDYCLQSSEDKPASILT